MPRPENSSPSSYELIYMSLVEGEKNWTQLLEETGLHRDTLSRRLKFLQDENMIARERRGRNVFYSLLKTERPYYGWEIKWEYIFMTKEDWENFYEEIDYKISEYEFDKYLEKKARHKFEKILDTPGNKAFYDKLVENEMLDDLRVKILLENIRAPYCLECIDKKRLVQCKYVPDDSHYACPECGLVMRTNRISKIMSDFEYFKEPTKR